MVESVYSAVRTDSLYEADKVSPVKVEFLSLNNNQLMHSHFNIY